MKKIALFFVATAFAFAVSAQDATTKSTSPTKAATAKDANTKEHVCTSACKDGKHTYACGEKGHTCGAACKKAAKASTGTKK